MKTIVPLLVLLFLSACDRDVPIPSDEGKVIGMWINGFTTTENVDGSVNSFIKPCSSFPFVLFRSDQTVNFQLREQLEPQVCGTTERFSPEGRWERLGNEKYRIFLEGRNGHPDTIVEPERIYFTQADTIMKIQFEPIVDNGVDKPFFFTTTFFKDME
jgi:hypothetical protein